MAIEAPVSSLMSPWPDRLRHSAIVLLAAAVSLAVIVVMGDLSALRGLAVFACIAAAALVPWQLHNPAASREDGPSIRPVETAAVSAIVAGMPHPAGFLYCARRGHYLHAPAAQPAPPLRQNQLAHFA